jgi:hypothetical protein
VRRHLHGIGVHLLRECRPMPSRTILLRVNLPADWGARLLSIGFCDLGLPDRVYLWRRRPRIVLPAGYFNERWVRRTVAVVLSIWSAGMWSTKL